MQPKNLFCLVTVLFTMCHGKKSTKSKSSSTLIKPNNTHNTYYSNIYAIPTPKGFTRIAQPLHSFGNWLHQIDLKNNNTVYLYNGQVKKNQTAQFAVLDITVGDKDLQQCADAVMRLRASYLFDEKRYADIIFYNNEQKAYQFTAPYTLAHFTTYLNQVFSYCGTASLTKQLQPKLINTIQAGDVFIRGGFPGHAVIVVDIAADSTGQKIFMLAQSYMPAQSIHILVNPIDKNNMPWYVLTNSDFLYTPEYTFTKNELKGW
jgi:Domain of unknown function (4846)